jgi:hypothetical protein
MILAISSAMMTNVEMTKVAGNRTRNYKDKNVSKLLMQLNTASL